MCNNQGTDKNEGDNLPKKAKFYQNLLGKWLWKLDWIKIIVPTKQVWKFPIPIHKHPFAFPSSEPIGPTATKSTKFSVFNSGWNIYFFYLCSVYSMHALLWLHWKPINSIMTQKSSFYSWYSHLYNLNIHSIPPDTPTDKTIKFTLSIVAVFLLWPICSTKL